MSLRFLTQFQFNYSTTFCIENKNCVRKGSRTTCFRKLTSKARMECAKCVKHVDIHDFWAGLFLNCFLLLQTVGSSFSILERNHGISEKISTTKYLEFSKKQGCKEKKYFYYYFLIRMPILKLVGRKLNVKRPHTQGN